MTVTATYKRYVNDPTTSEKGLHERSGQKVVVIGQVSENVDEEVGLMFWIVFEDGYHDVAFNDELSDWEGAEA